MTSMEFFRHPETESTPPIDWGTTEPRHIKVDPTLFRSPTYLAKKQPVNQLYRVSSLQLSNIRAHDQVEPRSLELNMNKYQNSHPFPMQHPLASQISNKAIFPDYVAPEDPKRGENILRSTTKSITVETKAQPEPIVVVSKTSGNPWRHELRLDQLPSQKEGAWWIDGELYQNPKPDRTQNYYPAPLKAFVPNPTHRSFSQSLDAKSWNILRNKEKELLQTTHQVDYYKDGLGSRAPLNTDNLDEKNEKLEKTGTVDESLKPYFKRGDGLYTKSLASFELSMKQAEAAHAQALAHAAQYNHDQHVQIGPYTRLEIDEYEMQKGREYKNFPEQQYTDVAKASITQNVPALERSKTAPVIEREASKTYDEFVKKNNSNILTAEKAARIQGFHDEVQKMEFENRYKELELITPDRDIRLLRIKMNDLENARGAKPNLKQNVKDHVNTLYEQEYKYLGERAELYKTSYDPYELKDHIAVLKHNRPPVTIDGQSNREDGAIPNDTYEHRPKLFAHKVFSDFHDKKRAPLEHGLLNPASVSQPLVQENGFILKQSTYGDNYNTKKYLQENEFESQRLTEPIYKPLSQAELDYQDIPLKSKVEEVALNDYKAGYTTDPKDYYRALEKIEEVDRYNKAMKQAEYPRYSGPLPPEPYEAIYCTDKIIEHGQGYHKRFESRVYDSPFVNPKPQFVPLQSDLQTLNEIEKKRQEEYARSLAEEATRVPGTSREPVTIKDRSRETVARRVDEILKEKLPITVHQKDYSQYYYKTEDKCPKNNFYEPIEYTTQVFRYDKPHQSRLTTLQDKWNKSDAQKKVLADYNIPTADLRQNKNLPKKPVFISPVSCANAIQARNAAASKSAKP